MQTNEVTELLNPAFCALVYASIVEGYNSTSKSKIPIYMPYILMPIVLHKDSRRVIPTSTRSKFHIWLQNEPQITIGLTDRINSIESHVSKGSMLLNSHGFISMDDESRIFLKRKQHLKNMIEQSEFISEYTNSAKRLGSICGRFNSESTALALLGVKL
ncbi:hypothetical protein ACCF70_000683 [Vibrio parahaemolyticus]|uniref:three component ABC system middle component n=1 Tax=Vibrio parahaemolyticus TaxID=670 RepID=UPI00111E6E50|nr:three component ABC system middle component [Vibrio parahaemolyticus]EGR1391767.1 hypothetical protein [Vibrio parahaemolyticus]EJY0897399.1 hypothetical protein [Vibrio parahaemolyticus]ELA7345061.1 hypothetical protein [Vibrio parahaemolyticus]MBE3938713.1 hypothetical protein [Vibrio parahaemolyticus]TOF05469.1 hypothetical protein CGJ29_19955 [Vibrio parahaemolyticus]